MIIQKLLEFKPSRDNLVGSYAIVPMDLNDETKVKKNYLSSHELEILGKLDHKSRVESFCAGRLAAKKTITLLNPEYLATEVSIIPGLLENPIILSTPQLNLNVSISHSQSFAFAAATSSICPIGVDTEVISNKNFNEYAELSTRTEILLTMKIFQEDELSSATRLWTLKESLSKAIKCGFTIPLDLLEIISFDEEFKNRCVFKNFPQYRGISFNFKDNMFALCLPYSINVYDNFPQNSVILHNSNI